jgi:hypothetical protein
MKNKTFYVSSLSSLWASSGEEPAEVVAKTSLSSPS